MSGVEFVPLVENDLNEEQRDVYSKLTPCIELMKKRLVRRFFFNSLGRSVGRVFQIDGSDRSKKFDYFQNTCVLGLYALSPDADFTFLKTFGDIASGPELHSLAIRSKDALWLLFKCLKGLDVKQVTLVSSTGFVKRLRGDYLNSPANNELSQRWEFFARVSRLNASCQLKEAFASFDLSACQMDENCQGD